MSRDELRDILLYLGWDTDELSRRVGVSKSTIYHWVDVPNPVEAYLNYVCRVREYLGGFEL